MTDTPEDDNDDTPKPKRDNGGRFEKGSQANPAGRPAGIVNKRTAEAQQIAERMGVNPLEVLLMFAGNQYKALYPNDPNPTANVPLDIRVHAADKAAQYLYPKLKAVEVTGKDGNPLEVYLSMPEEQRQQKLSALLSRVLGSK